MKINGEFVFKYKTIKDAKIVFNTLDVDNETFLKSRLNGVSVEYKLLNENLGTFVSTADDLIASEIVAEKIIKKTKQ